MFACNFFGLASLSGPKYDTSPTPETGRYFRAEVHIVQVHKPESRPELIPKRHDQDPYIDPYRIPRARLKPKKVLYEHPYNNPTERFHMDP